MGLKVAFAALERRLRSKPQVSSRAKRCRCIGRLTRTTAPRLATRRQLALAANLELAVSDVARAYAGAVAAPDNLMPVTAAVHVAACAVIPTLPLAFTSKASGVIVTVAAAVDAATAVTTWVSVATVRCTDVSCFGGRRAKDHLRCEAKKAGAHDLQEAVTLQPRKRSVLTETYVSVRSSVFTHGEHCRSPPLVACQFWAPA